MVASAEGLDVSNFQGRFDWAGAIQRYPDLAFGIYRMTQGLGTPGTVSPDPEAQWNHDQLKKLGREHGAYHFLDPRESGAAQAEYFVKAHAAVGLVATDMLWLDNETAGVTAAATSQCAQAFMHELDILTPYNPRGVYTFIDFAKHGYCAGLENYALWLAFPSSAAPAAPMPWTRWTFWQWGTRNGDDADAFNGTKTQLASWLASFAPKPPAIPQAFHASGLETWDQLAAKHGRTTAELVWQTAVHAPHGFGLLERHSIDKLGGEKPEPGTVIWA